MKMRCNIHVHSTFCDGANTPKEMVEAAIAAGYTDLGFSSHSPFPQDPTCPGIADEAAYTAEIAALKKAYGERINVLCGIEQEARAPIDKTQYDYVIGSCHYLPAADGGLVAVDAGPEELRQLAQNSYGGDMLRLAKAYYQHVAQATLALKPDVVGHFDLITKFNEDDAMFREEDAAYQRMALEAFAAAVEQQNRCDGLIEVNTGAMARGWRSRPYPAPFLLRYAAQHGARMIVTSDCHNKEQLTAGFEEACGVLRAAGFATMAVLQYGKFVDVPIEQ